MPINFTHRKPHRIAELTFVGVIMTIGWAMGDTFWAVYMKEFIKSDSMVGFLSGLFTFISTLAFFFFVPLVEKSDEAKLFAYCMITSIVSYLIYYFTENFWVFFLITICLVISLVLRRESYGLLIRGNSEKRSISKNQGLVYMLANLGWLIGPLIAGFVAEEYGIRKIYVFSAVFLLFALAVFIIFKIKDSSHKIKINVGNKNFCSLQNFKYIWQHKELKKTYLISVGLYIWWTIIYIYLPLLISESLSVIWVGYFLAAIPIPLIFLEYFVGKYQHKIGAKKLFTVGYSILSTVALAAFFIDNIYLLMGLFVFASIPVAFIEPTRESYFWELVPENSVRHYYGPYMSSIDIGSILGRVIFAAILLILPYKFIFLALFLLMLYVTHVAFSVKGEEGLRDN